MQVNPLIKYSLLQHPIAIGLRYTIFICLFVVSCTIPKKYQKGKPFITKNNIEVKGEILAKKKGLH